MCVNPITMKDEHGVIRTFPCGHCLECLKQKQNAWINRLNEELKSCNGKAVFFTLTYNDASVPKNYIYDYEIYRSPSDYAYSNVAVRTVRRRVYDETGKYHYAPVQEYFSTVSKENIKHADVPYCLVPEVPTNILDFNIQRKNHKQFIQHVKKIYADYLQTLTSASDNDTGSDWCHNFNADSSWDFDNYEGDLFSDTSVMDEDLEFLEEMNLLAEDEDYPDASYDIDLTEDSESYRPRPVMSFNSVRKEDVQNWLNRGRAKMRRLSKRLKIDYANPKYFICAEYGPRTLRPHYHGILFGVTKEQVSSMMKDWSDHFGFVSYDDVNLTKGGVSYVCKYVSKGFYEHPLCSRDFFYTHKDGSITEYHSKHYERCLELFNMDEPIVDPTFILVSKGMGIGFITPENVDYYTAGCSSIVTSDIVLTPYDLDRHITDLIVDSDFSLSHDFLDKERYLYSKKIEKPLKRKITYVKTKTDVNEEDFEAIYRRFKYNRFNPVTQKNIPCAMPDYYRKKMLGDGLRVALANYVQSCNVEVYREKLGQLQALQSDGENPQVVLDLERQLREEKQSRYSQTVNSFRKHLNKSKL